MNAIQAWINRSAVGFAGIRFMILSNGGGDAQWTLPVRVVERSVPGGTIPVIQNMGRGPWRVEYVLKLASVDDYAALCMLQGTSGTLTLTHGVAAAPRTAVVIGGDTYEQITGATLISVDDPVTIQGTTTCRAVFTRAVA